MRACKLPVRIAINGYGRIGRSVLRALVERQLQDQLHIIAINELADCKTIAHLTKYDSTHGRFPGMVYAEHDILRINDTGIRVLHEPDIKKLPWAALDIDLVIEASGQFTDRSTAELHLQQGAGHVLFTNPAQADVDATVIYGYNEQHLKGSERVVSAGACSTNCLIPVIVALDEAFGVEHGVSTTIHSAMNDQPVIDAYHHTDLRKTRSAFDSIIPVDTGLARGIDRLLPHLLGRFEAQAMRVPTTNVSAIDLSVTLKGEVSVAAVNQVLSEAASKRFGGVLGCTNEPLASCDFNHDSRSGIVDAGQTRVAGKHLAKVLTWFDNEWGYANRVVDIALYWGGRMARPESVK